MQLAVVCLRSLGQACTAQQPCSHPWYFSTPFARKSQGDFSVRTCTSSPDVLPLLVECLTLSRAGDAAGFQERLLLSVHHPSGLRARLALYVTCCGCFEWTQQQPSGPHPLTCREAQHKGNHSDADAPLRHSHMSSYPRLQVCDIAAQCSATRTTHSSAPFPPACVPLTPLLR